MSGLATVLGAYRRAFSGLPTRVWILAGGLLVNRAGTMVLPFLSLYLTRELGFSVERAATVLAMYGAGSVAGSFSGGWLSDRIGPVRVLLLSLLLAGAGLMALPSLTTFRALLPAIFLVSTVAESFRPALMTAVALASPPEVQARAFALVRLAVNLGMGIGPAVGGFLATSHYRWLFLGDGLTCWAAALLLLATLPREALGTPAPRRDAAPARPPWTDGPFLLFLGLVFLLALVFFQVFTTFPPFLREAYGLPESSIGLVLAFNAGLIVVFEMLLLRSVEHLDPVRLAGLGSFLVCAGFAILPLGRGMGLALLSTAVWSLGEMLSLPLANSIVARRAPREAAGRYMGAYALTFSSAFVVAPILGGAIYSRLGPAALWTAAGLVGLVLLAGFQLLAPAFGRPGGGRLGGEEVPHPPNGEQGRGGAGENPTRARSR